MHFFPYLFPKAHLVSLFFKLISFSFFNITSPTAFLLFHHSSLWELSHWCLPPRRGKNIFCHIAMSVKFRNHVCLCMCVRVCFKGTFIIKFHFLCRQTPLPPGWQTRGNEKACECVSKCVLVMWQILGCIGSCFALFLLVFYSQNCTNTPTEICIYRTNSFQPAEGRFYISCSHFKWMHILWT